MSNEFGSPLPDRLAEVRELLLTQDNRCTADPMYCVQVCERVGPLDLGYCGDNIMFYSAAARVSYYHDGPDEDVWLRLLGMHRAGELPEAYEVGGYEEVWKTVQVCFTEEGCNRHLELNGHNYGYYHGVRIYVGSFYRNPEMLEIRAALLGHTDAK